MSYQLKIDAKSLKAARFVARLQKKIQAALIESGMTQQQVAERLGVDRSVINRRLKGKANLTARSIAEFAYAFDKDIEIEFIDRRHDKKSNTASSSIDLVQLQMPQDFTTGNSSKNSTELKILSVAS